VSGAAYLAARTGAPVAAHPETAARLAGRVAVAKFLQDGDVIELAGDPVRRVRAVFTPGHAPGHLCFLEETTGFLVAGDMVAGIGTILIDPSEGDMGQYLASLRRLETLAPRVLLPAHGGAIVDSVERLQEYTGHRLWREARVLEGLRKHGSASSKELVPTVYDDVPVFVHGLAERSLLSHLAKLVDDGLALRDGDQWKSVGSGT
jgi:glyoxylase-like metal-dependent hydrolase (beta-lactamase superfamily II)